MIPRAIVTLLCIASFWVGTVLANIEDTVEKTFRVGEGGVLTLDTQRGGIEVRAAGSDQVTIVVQRKFNTNDRDQVDRILKDLKMEFTQTGNDVNVLVEHKDSDSFFGWDRARFNLHFIITVPEKYNVDLKTSGGSISVADLHGRATTRTSGGSLTFGHIRGPVTGKTSGGGISLQGCDGDADVNTSGGGIHIGEVMGQVMAATSGGSITIKKAKGSIQAKTSGGGIHVEEVMGTINASTSGGSVEATLTQQPGADCELSTSGGSITVSMAPDIRADVDAATSGGRVVTELAVTVQGELSKTHLTAAINGGGPKLTLRTSGGSIYLKKL